MSKKQKNVPLRGVVATSEVVLTSELKGQSIPVQKVEVMSTIDKTGREDKADWKGYMLKFEKSNFVAPINAGDILRLQEKTGKQLFEKVGDDAIRLTHQTFGVEDGKLVI